MAYALTQKDLQDLASQGVNIDGIPEGAEATAEEMSLLNVQPTPSPAADAPATGAPAGLTPTQQSYNAARAQGVAPENAPQSGGIPVTTPTPSPAMGAGGMGGGIMDLLSQPIPQDPFENLSRSQRTMIGFAALKDAGMALQGKEGGAVRGVMDDITARADMERKRRMQLGQLQQEQARQARLDALFAGQASGGAGAAPAASGLAGIDAQIEALRSQIGAYAQSDQMPLYQQKMAELTSIRDRETASQEAASEKAKVASGQMAQARDALSTAKKALSAATGLSGPELDKQLESGQIDPKSFALVRQGFVPDSKAFKDYQAAASKLASIMTFTNLSEILDAGVRLGTLSDADFALIGNITGIIDPVNMPQQTAETIFEAYGKLNNTIKRMEAEAAEGDDPYDAMVKKYEEEENQ